MRALIAIGWITGLCACADKNPATPDAMIEDAAWSSSRDAAVDAAPAVDAGTDQPMLGVVPNLSLGPLLGAVTDQSIKVWMRGDREGSFRVRYRTLDGAAIDSETASLQAEADFTGVVTLDNLSADTEYLYRIALIAPQGNETLDAMEYTFRTLPARGEPISLRFAVGADLHYRDIPSIPAFNDIAGMDPDFMLLIGDNIYADHLEATLDAYRAQYRRIWGVEQFRDLMSHVPLFMTWDDHEVFENWWQGSTARIAPGSVAFMEYQANHNPAPLVDDELFYTFSAGNVDFFMLETRSNRSNNDAEDNENKTMLGEVQMAALEEWLLTSDAPFKILVSSVMWADFGTTQNDSWFGFRSERQRIIDTIYDNHVEGVVIISGDQHWSAIFRNSYNDPPLVIYELEPTPLAFSNRTAPSTNHPSILFRDDDHQAYGVVDIDTTQTPPTIKLTVCAADLPCSPGQEPPPSTPFDAPRNADSTPVTVSLTLDDMGFVN